MNELDILGGIYWLSALWQPLESTNVELVVTPDDFFECIYTSPYEDWCVEDQTAAETLPSKHEDAVKNLARRVHEIAWSKYPNPEFCALIYDDVYTLASLLIINGGNLRLFTEQRLIWYQKGRVPCGYKGNFPDGVWLIA